MDSKFDSKIIVQFVIKILSLELAMMGMAIFLSYYMLNFAILLFALGILIGGIGALRGGPASIDSLYTKIIQRRWHQPYSQSLDQRTYIIEHSVSTYSFENVMTSAGLIAIVLGIFLIVSSK